MKNLTLLLFSTILFLITVQQLVAQVGIGTTDPKAMLHVAGDVSSTIRIDGLGSINPNNDGLRKVPVSVDGLGNLVLEEPITDRFVNKEDILPTKDYIETTVKNGFVFDTIYNYQVITTNDAKLMFVSYQMGLQITKGGSSTDKLNKTHEQKLYGLAIVVNTNATVDLLELQNGYAVSSNYFAANDKYFNGATYLSGQAIVPLEANKTYNFHLVAFIRNGEDDANGIRTTYGGNGNLDRFQLFELK